jgi:hypothetical protein
MTRPVTRRRAKPEPPRYLESSLCWPSEPEPTPVDTDKWLEEHPDQKLFVGWWANPYYSSSDFPRVGQGCCNTVHHSTWRTDQTDSQRTGTFYATEKEALLVCRWQVCRRMAEILTHLDRRSAEAQEKLVDEPRRTMQK